MGCQMGLMHWCVRALRFSMKIRLEGFILKDPADGKLILYKSSALGQPLRFRFTYLFATYRECSTSGFRGRYGCRDTNNVQCKRRNSRFALLRRIGALIAKRPIENIPDFELMAISTRGNLVAARSVDETINILNVRDSLKSFSLNP